ncbi:MAG: DUF86 domain-containing protein [Anaerolineae bacterium]
MINGVVLQKLQTLEQTLLELRSLGTVSVAQLEKDWRTWRAIERNLQVLVEIVIDVCQRLLSLTGQSPATTGRDAVARCIQLGVLSDDASYGKMVQFRNFIAHRYERVDVTILVDMVNRRLPDFDRFRDEVLAYTREQSVDSAGI